MATNPLFGMSLLEAQQKQFADSQKQFAALAAASSKGNNNPAAYGFSLLGAAIGNALGGGRPDSPEVAKAKNIQKAKDDALRSLQDEYEGAVQPQEVTSKAVNTLAQQYPEIQARFRKQQQADRTDALIQKAANGEIDPNDLPAVSKALLQSGDLGGALKVSQYLKTQAVNEFKAKTDRVKALKTKSVVKNVTLPDGSVKAARITTEGKVLLSDGKGGLRLAPEGTILAPTQTETKDITIKDKAIKDLAEVGTALEQADDLTKTFKRGYGGFVFDFVGKGVREIQKRTGASSEAIAWWRDYDIQQNEIRHRLFGSALTKTEGSAFDKISVHSGLDDDIIIANIAARRALAIKAARKLVNAQIAKGVPEAQAKAALGVTSWDLTQGATEAPQGATAQGATEAPKGASAQERARNFLGGE